MFYLNELSFLCDTFKKSRLGVQLIELEEFRSIAKAPVDRDDFLFSKSLPRLFPSPEPNTVYRLTDPLMRSFRLLLLPAHIPPSVLLVGPFLESPIPQEQILELGEKHGISPQKQHLLSDLFSGLPVLCDDSPLFAVFDTFCERIWRDGKYKLHNVSPVDFPTDTPISRTMRNTDHRDTLLSIKAMEQRYAFENQLIRAVSLGQTQFESQFSSALSLNHFEKRISDPIRNTKNYMIIVNTLLRKAAEQGGVHPIHIDQISSNFARKIEELASTAGVGALMSEMFRTYCRLVRSHSQKHMSPIVQKTVLTIDADLSADLSPRTLAQNQNVSSGYLSTIFRKETNKTISEYVRQKRMEYAAYLLETTSLQVQTVALHCGIMDVQYFSKLFKAHFSKTPSEYRRSDRPSGKA